MARTRFIPDTGPDRPHDRGHVPARRALRRPRGRADVAWCPELRRASSASSASASPSSSGGTPTRSRCGPCAPARSAPEEAPELHGMIDRLCALADMPKPRVAIADTDLPNAFATGRSPSRSAVCVTTGILRHADRRGARGRAGPRAVPRRAPRRAGDDRGLVGRDRRRDAHPGGAVRRIFGVGRSPQQQRRRSASSSCWCQPGRLRDQLPAACGCSRATASCAPTGPGAYLTQSRQRWPRR